jgi:hypothetical protein
MRSAILLLMLCAAATAAGPPIKVAVPASGMKATPKKAAKAKPPGDHDFPLVITGSTITVITAFPAIITAPDGYDSYDWRYPDKMKAAPMPGTENKLEITAAPEGTFNIVVTARSIDYEFDAEGRVKRDDKGRPIKRRTAHHGKITAAVGKITPGPGPGPTPDPDPKPPPDPDVKPPLDVKGLHVMIIYETRYPEKLTLGQKAAINGRGEGSLAAYLDAKTPKEASGQPSYRFADPSATAEHDLPVWQAALKRPRKELPWIVISTERTGFEGPLPKTHSEILELVKKYGE